MNGRRSRGDHRYGVPLLRHDRGEDSQKKSSWFQKNLPDMPPAQVSCFVRHIQSVMEAEPMFAGGVTGSNRFLEFTFSPPVNVVRDGSVFESS